MTYRPLLVGRGVFLLLSTYAMFEFVATTGSQPLGPLVARCLRCRCSQHIAHEGT